MPDILPASLPNSLPKPNVLFLNTRSALGADVAVHFTLIQHFDPATITVHLATNHNSEDHEKTLALLRDVPGLHLLSLDLGHEVSGAQNKSGKSRKLGKFSGAIKNIGAFISLVRLAFYVVQNSIDVIHSTDRPRDAGFATLLAKLTGRKNVVHAHIKWYPNMGRLTEWALRDCTVLLTISEFCRDSFVEGGIPRSKIALIYNTSDPDRFSPERKHVPLLRKNPQFSNPTPLVGIVARIMLYKGQRELVQAFARVRERIPNAQLAIIGKEDTLTSPDDYRAQVATKIAELGLGDCVHFVGWSDDIPAVLQELDVLAVPSWEEPFGLVVTEAMLSQRPVVGFASGALPEIIVPNETGLLTPPMDTDALADALITLLNDSGTRERMGKAGRARAIEKFSPVEKAAELVELYKRIISGKTPGS